MAAVAAAGRPGAAMSASSAWRLGLAAMEELGALASAPSGWRAGEVGDGAAGPNGGIVLAGLARLFNEASPSLRDDGQCALPGDRPRRSSARRRRCRRSFRLTGLRGASAADAVERAECEKHLAALPLLRFRRPKPYDRPEGEGNLAAETDVMQPLRGCGHRPETAAARRAALRGSPVRRSSRVRRDRQGHDLLRDGDRLAVDGRLEQIFPTQPAGSAARLQMLATGPAPEVSFPRPVYWRHGLNTGSSCPMLSRRGFRDRGGEGEWTHSTEPTELIQGLLDHSCANTSRCARRSRTVGPPRWLIRPTACPYWKKCATASGRGRLLRHR